MTKSCATRDYDIIFSKKLVKILFKMCTTVNHMAKLMNWLERFFILFVGYLSGSGKKKADKHRKISKSDSKVTNNESFMDTITLLFKKR